MQAFQIAALPHLFLEDGGINKLPELILRYGKKVLLVTGGSSFGSSVTWSRLSGQLDSAKISVHRFRVHDEPSPQLVDDAVAAFRLENIQVVVAIGGGSVLDAAKAIAGLLPYGNSVLDHLEGVGKGIEYQGPSLPMIAVPTTAGTGSEATKNAVLSVQGEQGYKKSFRHDTLVPRIALLDPQLLATCPTKLIAAQGMDAFTQLLEAFVSTRANPFCDALIISGLQEFNKGFWPTWEGGDTAAATRARASMLYAAYISGVALAQVGLGSVHGLASPLGAFFPIPHGIVCGTLVAAATELNIRLLEQRDKNHPALEKYATVGRLICGELEQDDSEARQQLVEVLLHWTERLQLPHLSEYGVGEGDIDRIVANSRGNSMLTNPLVLTDEEIAGLIRVRL
ncbi:MAG: iron-containing alcohol dehydrogenase [Gammaproteobacteria bacterium]|nr:iron-containing alcohol dehydrogenase [Gammaproteobacteria bacterium]